MPFQRITLRLTKIHHTFATGLLKNDIVASVGGYNNVHLKLLPRLRREGDGDCGICFEYAVHEAMSTANPQVLERVMDATNLCNFGGDQPKSILFGLEKTGAQQLIATANEILTDDSRVLSGTPGQPAKLRRYLNTLAAAFRNPRTRLALPYSIMGLWKADLFIGFSDTDRWVGTSVKINARDLEEAAGLRIGIVPVRQGVSDQVRKHETKNLVICPIDLLQKYGESLLTEA